MPQASWMIRLDNANYQVELEHGLIMGDRKIKVNGEEIFKARKLIDFGSTHRFEINGRNAALSIRTSAFPFVQYSLSLNGRSYGSITPALPTWLWAFLIPYVMTFLNIMTAGLGSQAFRAMTQNERVLFGSLRGGIAGGIAGFGFAVCAAVSLNKNLSHNQRNVLCALITLITCALTMLLLDGIML
ncbi:MAG: hypothetical protein U0528_09685 [Anaerolineae bacterium]